MKTSRESTTPTPGSSQRENARSTNSAAERVFSPAAAPLCYDHLVIGSSPLMLLVALQLAEAGENVLVVDRDSERGGAWQITTLEIIGDRPLKVENACHVIEVFPQVYDLLEGASGVPFVELDAQPVRIHATGLIVPYFGRAIMLLSLMRLLLGYSTNWFQLRILRQGDPDRFENFRTKLKSLLLYQTPELLRGAAMKGPKHGFVDFMARLTERCLVAGARFERFEVSRLARDGNVWEARDEAGTVRSARVVHTTTSANLRAAGPDMFRAEPSERVLRAAAVVAIPRSDTEINQTYAAFWRDPLVSRISRLDAAEQDNEAALRFLVEAKTAALFDRADLDTVLRVKLERARILQPGGTFALLGTVSCLYARNIDQLPEGEICTNLYGYYSNGNLAAGIAAWLARSQQKRAPVPART